MTHRFRKTALVAVGVLSAFSAVQAAAQDVPLEEIVITARQREEKLVDVPATVQAFTASEIKNAGIERPQDFIAMTPGVAQVQTAEAGDMQVTIRGINTGRDAETNFALVIDGVLQTNPNALNQELANVSQIEVLKGPQGALYGRNAVAGAMIISTRKPTDKLELDLGGGYGQFNATLYASIAKNLVGAPVDAATVSNGCDCRKQVHKPTSALRERGAGANEACGIFDAAQQAAAQAEPQSDLNATAAYREHLAKVLVRRALEESSK